MIRCAGVLALTWLVVLGVTVSSAEDAEEARCFTTDDGAYPCHVRNDSNSGSIEMIAPGRPTYILQLSSPDEAYGFAVLGGETVRLPAEFLRRPDDPGCWRNSETNTEICVW